MSVQTFSAAAVPKPGMSMMGMTCGRESGGGGSAKKVSGVQHNVAWPCAAAGTVLRSLGSPARSHSLGRRLARGHAQAHCLPCRAAPTHPGCRTSPAAWACSLRQQGTGTAAHLVLHAAAPRLILSGGGTTGQVWHTAQSAGFECKGGPGPRLPRAQHTHTRKG